MAADAIRTRYQEYVDFVNELNKNAKILDGLFGTGDAPRNNPGHTEFYESVPSIVAALIEAGVHEDIVDGATFMLCACHKYEKECRDASWMMMAAQQHALPLLDLLTPAEAKALLAEFDKCYPKRLRFPVQKNIAKILKKRASGKG